MRVQICCKYWQRAFQLKPTISYHSRDDRRTHCSAPFFIMEKEALTAPVFMYWKWKSGMYMTQFAWQTCLDITRLCSCLNLVYLTIYWRRKHKKALLDFIKLLRRWQNISQSYRFAMHLQLAMAGTSPTLTEHQLSFPSPLVDLSWRIRTAHTISSKKIAGRLLQRYQNK